MNNVKFTKKSIILLVAIFVTLIFGCSSTAVLNRIDTTTSYSNPLPLRTALVIPDEITTRIVHVNVTGSCASYGAKIDVGMAYQSAILNGLRSALKNVILIDSIPTSSDVSNIYDLVINVSLTNENSTEITSGNGGMLMGNDMNAQFQVSFTLNYADSKGKSIYSTTANGTSFFSSSGGCNSLADPEKQAMEKALKQVCDFIAQSTFSAAPINDYAKSVSPKNQ